MKVKEVIEKLKQFDQELPIVVFNGEFENEVENIETKNFDGNSGELYEDDNGKIKAIVLY